MPSFRSTVLATAVLLAGVAQADYVIDPESVDMGTREFWCDNEKDTCPLICQQTKPGTTLVNECDPEKLTYGCLCGDNKRPNISEYTLTLPFFVCQEWGNQCVNDCKGDQACSSSCREDHPCGASSPQREKNKTTGTATAAPSASQTDDELTIYTDGPGSDDDDNGGSGKPGAAPAMQLGRNYGLAVVFGSLFLGFALL